MKEIEKLGLTKQRSIILRVIHEATEHLSAKFKPQSIELTFRGLCPECAK